MRLMRLGGTRSDHKSEISSLPLPILTLLKPTTFLVTSVLLFRHRRYSLRDRRRLAQ
jgi:hypothetical protein